MGGMSFLYIEECGGKGYEEQNCKTSINDMYGFCTVSKYANDKFCSERKERNDREDIRRECMRGISEFPLRFDR